MKITLALLVALLLVGQAPARGGAAAQNADEAEAQRLTSEAVRLFNEGKYGEALPPARQAVALLERAHGADHPSLIGPLLNLGAIQLERKESDESERAHRRALALAEKHAASNAGLAGNINTRLGVLRSRAGDLEEAEGFFMRALALKEQAKANPPLNLAPDFLNLAEVQLARRGFDRGGATLDRLTAYLRARPPKKEEAAARRVRSFLCPLLGAKQPELEKKVWGAIFRLSEPEAAAGIDREKEAEEAGGPTAERVLNGRVVRSVPPTYPPAAKARRLSGTVLVWLKVGEEGRVLEAEALCGHQALAGAAVEAVRKWEFAPTMLDGKPVKVTGTVRVNFVLQ